MKTRNKMCLIFLILLTIPLVIFAQPVEKIKPNIGQPERIIIEPPDYRGGFNVNVWVGQSTYYSGEDIQIGFKTNSDAYIYIFDTDTTGATRQIFPNFYDRDNFVHGNRTYYIPDSSYNLRVVGPSGREYIKAIAIRERYRFFDRYLNFSSSDPFPQRSRGPEELINNVKSEVQQMEKSQSSQPQAITRSEQGPDKRIIIEPPYPPSHPSNYYAEDDTSFIVRGREANYGYGKVRVTSSPDNARVYIDGRYYGKTPITVSGLEYGEHSVEVYKKGYRSWTKSIDIYNRETIRVVAYLRPGESDWYSDKEGDDNLLDIDIRLQGKYEKGQKEEPSYSKNKYDKNRSGVEEKDKEIDEDKVKPYTSEKVNQQFNK